jgi:hypothetical protein
MWKLLLFIAIVLLTGLVVVISAVGYLAIYDEDDDDDHYDDYEDEGWK